MKPSILLRIAAIITLLYWVGHTIGAPWTPGRGPAEMSAIEAMKAHRFIVEGSSRTYWDFYFGFGVAISGFLLVQALVLWQLAKMAVIDAVRVRPVIASFFVAFTFNAIVAWTFFFIVPAVLAVAIAISLGLALFMASRGSSPKQAANAGTPERHAG